MGGGGQGQALGEGPGVPPGEWLRGPVELRAEAPLAQGLRSRCILCGTCPLRMHFRCRSCL